jgi:hypothetical protein
MRIPNNRRGFATKEQIILESFTPINPPSHIIPLVYYSQKLTHNGITAYKTFENCSRKVHRSSIANLLSNIASHYDSVESLLSDYKNAHNDDERSKINDEAIKLLNQEQWEVYLQKTRQSRHLNMAQSRKIRSLCDKLSYYSGTRIFKSKKSGSCSMRIAFLTLTTPANASPSQALSAFSLFCDYLSRTANCVYVWKKELGVQHNQLHFHIVINNFIPYYIVAWKWKRLLIAAGVLWPKNEFGIETASHYRIELPKSKKAISHYISKYMSKAYDLPGNFGYISGHSRILTDLKETVLIENEIDELELKSLMSRSKIINRDYVSLVFHDLLTIKSIAPKLFAVFEAQYVAFNKAISLTQKFNYV